MSIHIVWCWKCSDRLIQEIKVMSKVSKIFYKFQCFKCYVCQRHWRWCLWLLHNTAYRVLLLNLLMPKVLKMPNTMYFVYRASCPCQEGRLQYLNLPSWGFSSSPPISPRRQLCQLSWTCQTRRVIKGTTHSQSPILKTKGALSNPVILTYLQQSCILHTLNKLPA